MTHRITIKGYSCWKGGWHSVTIEAECSTSAEQQAQAALVWFDEVRSITRTVLRAGVVINTTAEPAGEWRAA